MTSHRDEFQLNGNPRSVSETAVAQLDAALAVAAGSSIDRVLHGIDPRRILRFEQGGPPVWSVASCPCQDGAHLFVTYGLSRFIDPDAAFDFEMSLRVPSEPGGQPPAWPMFLLRQLARYQITSGRELKVGDPMSFGESITRAAMGPQHKASMPDSSMSAVGITTDPGMQSIRRVYGLLPDEQALSEVWSTAGLLNEIARRDPTLSTRLGRRSWALDAELRAAVLRGAEREGSTTGAIVVPGLRWEQDQEGLLVHIPGGPVVPRILAMIRARVGFGRTLLMHDFEPRPFSEVGLTPSGDEFVRAHGDRMLELGLEADSPLLTGLTFAAQESNPSPVTLRLR